MTQKKPEIASYKLKNLEYNIRASWRDLSSGGTVNLGIRAMKRREKDPWLRQTYKENAWDSIREKTPDRRQERLKLLGFVS